jgi:hypothetical protein
MIHGTGRLLIDHRDIAAVEFKLQVTQPTPDAPGYASGYLYAHRSDDGKGVFRIAVVSTLGVLNATWTQHGGKKLCWIKAKARIANPCIPVRFRMWPPSN